MKIRSPSCCSRRTKIDANWIPEKRRKKYRRCFREKWPGKRSSWRREFFFFFHRAEPNGQWIGRLQRRELVVTQSVSFAIRKRRKRATVPIGKQLDLDMPIRNGRWSVHDGQRIQKTVSESVGGRLQKFNGILLIVHWPVQLEDATSVKSVRDGRNDVTVKKFCSSLKNSSVFSINSVTGFLTFSPELMDGNNSRLSSWRTVVYKRTFVLPAGRQSVQWTDLFVADIMKFDKTDPERLQCSGIPDAWVPNSKVGPLFKLRYHWWIFRLAYY